MCSIILANITGKGIISFFRIASDVYACNIITVSSKINRSLLILESFECYRHINIRLNSIANNVSLTELMGSVMHSPIIWLWNFRNGKIITNQLKETSVKDASTTPPKNGTREPTMSK